MKSKEKNLRKRWGQFDGLLHHDTLIDPRSARREQLLQQLKDRPRLHGFLRFFIDMVLPFMQWMFVVFFVGFAGQVLVALAIEAGSSMFGSQVGSVLCIACLFAPLGSFLAYWAADNLPRRRPILMMWIGGVVCFIVTLAPSFTILRLLMRR